MLHSRLASATRFYKLFMRPRRISIRHKKLVAAAEPSTTVLARAPVPCSVVETATRPLNATLLKIGDYLLGEPDCPTLYGHPGIRY